MTELTKELAIALVREHSWPTERDKTTGTCPSCGEGLGDYTRRVIHTWSMFGADNDAEGVIDDIRQPDATVEWTGPGQISMGHDLTVTTPHNGRRYRVQVHHLDPACDRCAAAKQAVTVTATVGDQP